MKWINSIMILLFPITVMGQLSDETLCGAAQSGLYYPQLQGKRVGVVVNAASVINNINLVDKLIADQIDVRVVFSPEHGFRMEAEAGEAVGHSIDSLTRLPIISLYGKHKKPTEADLVNVDILLFDLQDVGVRFFTYLSTMACVMEAGRDCGIPVIVLDRPNPNTFYIDGPVLEKSLVSFVGLHPVPVVYGMTIGEYALMVNGEGWLSGGKKCSLTVIPVSHYNHRMRIPLAVKPSPNLPTLNSILLYPSLCLFEGTDVSVGRGTPFPFEVYGHPEIKRGSFTFTPVPVKGMSMNPPQNGKPCKGEDLRAYYERYPDSLGKVNLSWLIAAYRELRYGGGFFNGYFAQLAGNSRLKQQIMDGISEKKIRASWKPGLDKFKKTRKKYLLYKD